MHLPDGRYQGGHREVDIHKRDIRVCSWSDSRTLHWCCIIVSWDTEKNIFLLFSVSSVVQQSEANAYTSKRELLKPGVKEQLRWHCAPMQAASFAMQPRSLPRRVLCVLWGTPGSCCLTGRLHPSAASVQMQNLPGSGPAFRYRIVKRSNRPNAGRKRKRMYLVE